MDTQKDKYFLQDLKDLMTRLRNKDNGCPWDIEQDFSTIKPHTIEEAYEVADAIERGDMNELKDELGDLLFQVIFHAQMASEQDAFTMDDVIDHVTKKMIFRHPHVFEGADAHTANDVKDKIWEQQKAKEKAAKADNEGAHYLDSVTRGLPSLLLANKVQKRVRKIGFKYDGLDGALDKLAEEIAELKQAIKANDAENIQEEYGDVLFVATLLAAHLDVNPEETLRQGTFKFINRFNAVENKLREDGHTLETATIEDMTVAWQAIKADSQKP